MDKVWTIVFTLKKGIIKVHYFGYLQVLIKELTDKEESFIISESFLKY